MQLQELSECTVLQRHPPRLNKIPPQIAQRFLWDLGRSGLLCWLRLYVLELVHLIENKLCFKQILKKIMFDRSMELDLSYIVFGLIFFDTFFGVFNIIFPGAFLKEVVSYKWSDAHEDNAANNNSYDQSNVVATWILFTFNRRIVILGCNSWADNG